MVFSDRGEPFLFKNAAARSGNLNADEWAKKREAIQKEMEKHLVVGH